MKQGIIQYILFLLVCTLSSTVTANAATTALLHNATVVNKDEPNNLLLQAKLHVLHSLLGFSRLGILAPANNPEAGKISANAKQVGNIKGFTVVAYTEANPLETVEECTTALDYLYFDDIDSILIGSEICFSHTDEQFTQLIDMIHQRGIISIAQTQQQVLAGAFIAISAQGEQTLRKATSLQAAPLSVAVALNLSAAELLGITPSLALLTSAEPIIFDNQAVNR